MRRSRCRADSAWKFTRAVSVPITTAVNSITAKVKKYCVSVTANVKCGGMKKKSNAATPSTEAKMAGPRPQHSATPITASR